MKTTFKVIASVFALGLVLFIGLHLFLLYGLTKTMREVVLPRIKTETGIDAAVGGLSINMAGGLLHLNDVEVRNPAGFLLENMASIKRIDVVVDIPSLFKQKPVIVKSVQIETALVNIIRNKEGEINLNAMQSGMPKPSTAPMQPVPKAGQPEPARVPETGQPAPVEQTKPLPELLIEALQCNATVRYVDLRLNQLDIALNLNLIGNGLSTQTNSGTPWGDVTVIGSLGNNRTSFITDITVHLAPITDPEALSFDLTGKMLEIDPSIMEEAYNKLRIRSAPFGLDLEIHCRKGWFEESSVALNIKDIVFKDKLAKKLGGIGTIASLRFPVSIGGSLQKPVVDVQQALYSAIGGNAQSVLDSFLKGAAAKKAGLDEPPATLSDAAVEVLGEHVGEIGDSETIKKVLKDLADGEPSATNAPPSISSDVLVDILGEQIDEIGENEALKKDLKNLGKILFGK